MISFKMSWFLIIFFLGFKINVLTQATHEKKLPSAVVVGTVYCDTCFQHDFAKPTHFLSGASVLVSCKEGTSRPTFHQEVRTDEHGQFRVHLPFSVSKHVKKIKGCSVKLISSNEPYCAVASSATSSSLHLRSRKEGTHIFSAGFFTFKPLKQPNLCNQKPSFQNSKEFSSRKTLFPPTENTTFPPPIQDPTTPDVPLLPRLPPLPPLPGLPFLPPIPREASDSSKRNGEKKVFLPSPQIPLPPNPLLPPPVLPPNPLQPPSFFPPNPLLPPPAPLIPLPHIPGLTPPPPPAFPFPLPPFPFPGPGIPPAAASSKKLSP